MVMDNIINLKEKYREHIERKASEQFEAIKIAEDIYMIASNKICSSDNYEPILDCVLYSDMKLIQRIRKMKFKNNDLISITCKKIKKNNVKVLELIKVTEDMNKDSIIELEVKSHLLYEDRESLLQTIANENRDKQIFVNFYDYYNFNQLEELINE
ncbi:hypothetical protein ACQPVP_09230 [Clostridium nigeriense]|uniref:hypothetical protein n=1 Tax=Clostridium nigeriense TaxID=1805470 RepID=UPI003D32BD04